MDISISAVARARPQWRRELLAHAIRRRGSVPHHSYAIQARPRPRISAHFAFPRTAPLLERGELVNSLLA
jgi:hypothetical protein